MSCFPRIIHVHTESRFSRSHKESRLSHLPRGCFWAAATGMTGSPATFRESPTITASPRPERRDTPAPPPQRPLPPDGPAPRSAPSPAAPGGPAAPQAAFSCWRGWRCSEGPHLLLPPRPVVPAPRRIVVVCLCLLKLGREKGLPVKAAWNAGPGTTDSSVSKLRKQAARAGTRPRSGAARPAQEHAVAEGKTRACRQDRGPFCVEAGLPSPPSAAWGPNPLDQGQSQVGSTDFLIRPLGLVPEGKLNHVDFLETDGTSSFSQRHNPCTLPLLK